MLNLFSGPYRRNRNDGLSRTVKTFGWDSVTDVDNHSTLGGGWQADLLNDSFYTGLLQSADSGAFDAIVCAFPCSTTTVARCFDASGDGGDPGPPQLRDADFPDGLPHDRLSKPYIRELINANRLLDRTIKILIAAHRSPRRTTLILENPSDRSIPGTAQHMADVSHGSLFATSQFKQLQAAIPNSSMATFANCMLDGVRLRSISLFGIRMTRRRFWTSLTGLSFNATILLALTNQWLAVATLAVSGSPRIQPITLWVCALSLLWRSLMLEQR